MAEPDFGGARRAVERSVKTPDFATVSARGHGIRRRRRAAAAVVTVAAVAATVVGTVTLLDALEPARTPDPVTDPAVPQDAEARDVLHDPNAELDLDAWEVNAGGDILAVVQSPGPPSPPRCPRRSNAVFVWMGSDGDRRVWLDYATARPLDALDGGFVVAGVPPSCLDGQHPEDAEAYVVDPDGERHPVSWSGTGDSGRRLAKGCRHTLVDDDRCLVSLDGRGAVADTRPVDYPPGSLAIDVPRGSERLWARSVSSERLFWSDDRGASWASRRTGLPPGDNVSVSVAGDWVLFATDTMAEFSSDAGETWQTRDLAPALSAVEVTDVGWTVTESGTLLGVTGRLGSGDQLFRSTDSSWTEFRPVQLRTRLGYIYPEAAGRHLFVLDERQWLRSDDQGRTWEVVDPFAG